MNQVLGLRILSQIMKWDDERARHEFEWLRWMARWKYDGYQDFLAGVRFIESLAAWLQQFSLQERETAYNLVRKNLLYICAPTMQRLVEIFYPRIIEHRLMTIVGAKLGIPKYKIWADPEATKLFECLRRKTLFMALSDGARIDDLRHANVDILSNEQLVIATQIDKDKWNDILKSLRKDLKDQTAQFAIVVLVDDFMATGTSFLRFVEKDKEWKGKLARFNDSVKSLKNYDIKPFEPNAHLCVHHYVSSYDATISVQNRINEIKKEKLLNEFFDNVHLSYGIVLPQDLPIDKCPAANAGPIDLANKYYDPIIRTEHTDIGGVAHLGLGYGGCALPLVLEHNTPNNSIALLWAETDGGMREGGIDAPAMRPLFRRRQRHS
jgi:hypothetical protein